MAVTAPIVGDTIFDSFTILDNGIPVDPDTVSLVVRDPAGNVTTYTYGNDLTIVKDAVGEYHASQITGLSGIWIFDWLATGTYQGKSQSTIYVAAGQVTKPLLLTPTEVANYMLRTFTGDEARLCAWIIEQLQDELEMHYNRPLYQRAISELRTLPKDTYQLFLWKPPVVSVQSVFIEGNLVDAGAYLVYDWGLEFSYLLAISFDWYQFGESQVQVNYTGGLDGLNYRGLKSLLVRVAQREMKAAIEDIQGLTSYHVEGESIQIGNRRTGNGLQGFTDQELQDFSRPKNRVIAF